MTRFLSVCVLLAMLVTSALPLMAQGDSPRAPLDYIALHRDDLALVCFDPATPELGIYHNADERFPLASALKIAILAAYAERIAAEEAALADTYPLEAIDAYYLPGCDSGAHASFLEEIAIGHADLTLDELLGGMIVYGSDAIADFLLAHLDEQTVPALYRRLGITATDTPFSMLGLYLVMSNHETGIADPTTLTPAAFWKAHTALAERYITDEVWRAAERAYRAQPHSGLPDYARQAAFLARFGMQGTAQEVSTLIQAAYSGEVIDPAAQEIMRRYLDWPLAGRTPLDTRFTHFGMKNGAWPGVLTTTYYTIDSSGQAIALTVLLRHIPPEQWLEWLATLDELKFELEAIKTRCGALEQSLVSESAT